jgi:hypothetical protein
MNQIFYDLTNSKIKFCSTSYEYDLNNNLHYLSYTKGYLGEVNDFENIIIKDYSEIETFLREIKIKYPDEVQHKINVRLSFLIDKDLKQLDAIRFDELLNHFLKTAEFATVNSGQGEFKDVNLIKFNNDYYFDFEVIDKDLFFKVFLDLITLCGCKRNSFVLTDNNIINNI